ncbi:dendritic cell-specific transmembrane protein [Hyperolius riggenbachi]|uniref:dendritic cell-specific transmembrane protein n=1 Tax=Hyperolius riggenbachi TaxID=752182 RepID=UPI0035A29D29
MVQLKQMSAVFSKSCKIFISGNECGWKNRLWFGFLCLLFGLTVSTCLILVSILSKVGLGRIQLVSTFSLGLTVSIFAYIFKSVRCMSVLFLLSCGMREGRNVLITVGTSIVVFNNVKNILGNLKIVADCIICNLEVKLSLLKVMPFKNYSDMIRRVYLHAKEQFFNPFNIIVSFSDHFQCRMTISDEKLKVLLNETKVHILTTSSNISAMLDIITFVGHIVFLVLGVFILLIGSWLFFKAFLVKKKTNNMYITKQFLQYDENKRQRGERCVLPLSKTEQNKFIRISSLKMSRKQKQSMALFFLPILTNIFIWSLISFLDFMLYWFIATVAKNLQGLGSVDIPITMSFIDKHVDLSTFNIPRNSETLASNIRINLFEPQCIPVPALSASWIPLSVLTSVLVFFGLISSFLIQIKILVMSAFYPEKELERVQDLHQKILRERSQESVGSRDQTHRSIFTQACFWFPILTRKHYVNK